MLTSRLNVAVLDLVAVVAVFGVWPPLLNGVCGGMDWRALCQRAQETFTFVTCLSHCSISLSVFDDHWHFQTLKKGVFHLWKKSSMEASVSVILSFYLSLLQVWALFMVPLFWCTYRYISRIPSQFARNNLENHEQHGAESKTNPIE